jgi:hypothetical protein
MDGVIHPIDNKLQPTDISKEEKEIKKGKKGSTYNL